jgi:hypothetical protein
LLFLQRMVDGGGADVVREMITSSLEFHGGLSERQIAEKLVCFGANGVSTFQGSRNGVTVQLQKSKAPYLFGVHYMAHRTNLVVEQLSNLLVVIKIESLCKNIHSYFSHSPKRHLEFTKLAEIVETEGLKILNNVKTRWISLLEPLIHILGEYKTLIAKMCEDAVAKDPEPKAKEVTEKAKHNLDLLCDVGTLLALPCILPLLEYVDSLMRFIQSRDIFVSNYVVVVKICQTELYKLYCNLETSFRKSHFQEFCDIVDDYSFTITQEWVTDLNDGSESLSFTINGRSYPAHSLCLVTTKKKRVGRDGFEAVISSVKGQATSAAKMLISELSKRFPSCDLMDALGIVFPQFWLQANCDALFPLHLKTLKAHFYELRSVISGSEKDGVSTQVSEPLDAQTLDLQTSLFKLMMKSNAKSAIEEPHDMNPVTKLWMKLGSNALLLSCLSEYMKVANIAMTAVLGSVDNERTFSTLKFMKQVGGDT